jgi:hypothetical protein
MPSVAQDGADTIVVAPTYRDPDAAWLNSIGFKDDGRGTVNLGPYWVTTYWGESGQSTVVNPAVNVPAARFVSGSNGIDPVPDRIVTTPESRWLAANGIHQEMTGGDYTLSYRWVDASGRQIGDIRTSHDTMGAVVGAVVQAVSTAVLAVGAAGAAGAVAGGVAGSTATGATTVAEASTANVLPDASTLSSASPYDSFAYSSGEAQTALTDASNVDFGFGVQADAGAIPPTQAYPATQDFIPQELSNVTFNDTPEVITSDYGTTYPTGTWGPEVEAIQQATVPAAVTPGVASTGTLGNLSGGGALSPILKAIFGTPAQAKPATRSNSGTGSTAAQVEGTVPRTYAGQLGANDWMSQQASGVSPMVWLAAGVGVLLIVVALRKG